jgi:colanic acid/amylovoran biosynthesis protein
MYTSPVKVCILGAAFNTPNMGVSVLAAGALGAVLEAFPHAELIQMDYAHNGYDFFFDYHGASANVRFVNFRFSKRLFLANNIALLLLLAALSNLIPFVGLRRRMLCRNATLKKLLETDLVLSLAGGDSFSDIYGMRRFLYVALPQLLAIAARKRLILLPQTIGPFRHKTSRHIAGYILRKAEVVCSRDRAGEVAVRSWLKLSNDARRVRFCPDLGFNVDACRPRPLRIDGILAEELNRRCLVGVNISGLLMRGGYTGKNMFGLTVSYERLMTRLIEFLIEQRSARVLLIPHVSGTSIESDSAASQAVYEKLRCKCEGSIGLVREGCDYAELKYYIGLCAFFVGARMHACIGALSQNVPAVSIAYSDKFVGVMESIGCGELVLDARKLNETEILALVDSLFSDRESVRRVLVRTMPSIKEAVKSVLSSVTLPDQEPNMAAVR